MHLRDMNIEELSSIPCEICGIGKMDDEACIVAMKNNEPVCSVCCGCCD